MQPWLNMRTQVLLYTGFVSIESRIIFDKFQKTRKRKSHKVGQQIHVLVITVRYPRKAIKTHKTREQRLLYLVD